MNKLMAISLLLALTGCSDDEDKADIKDQLSASAEKTDTQKSPVDRSKKPELSAATQEDALSIREAADRAAALVEAEAAEQSQTEE